VSANMVVDLHATVLAQPTIAVDKTNNWPASGPLVGDVVDLLHANTLCNLQVVAPALSGVVRVQVQVSDSTTSGSFTDPVSGYGQFPQLANVHSGGVMIFNSGVYASGALGGAVPPAADAPLFCSGGVAFGAFQRTGRYARAILLSGQGGAGLAVNFISQLKTVGSGAGFTYSPTSGVPDV
jgi:hypothetical protein